MSSGPDERTLQELLDEFAATPEESSENIDGFRKRIDALDRLVLALLNERARMANVIGHIKKRLGLPVYVPSREVEVLENVRAANAGPLPDHAVTHLFERIIDETRALERRQYEADESGRVDPRS